MVERPDREPGEYSVPCQRCDGRNATQKKINNERACWVFAAATGRTSDVVRLCVSCLRTVNSLAVAVARVKPRKSKTW